MKNEYKFKCKICGNPMVKAGKNDAGKQRYKCNVCNTRTLVKKETKSRQNELKLFVKWIINSTKVIDKIDMPRRTFYRKINWCWNVIPTIKSDGIPSDFIVIDATVLSDNLLLLIVRNEKYVLNFRWAQSENEYDYCELLKGIDEPPFVICDGNSAIAKACRKLWKNIDIQRCLVHIVRNAQKKLGKRSPSEINHIFRRHIIKLTTIDTLRKSENWTKKFYALCDEHKDYIEEFSYSVNEETGEVIRRFRSHQKLFSVCNEIKNLLAKNRLFLFVENNIPNNSNHLEGGINSPLSYLQRCHRGMSIEHQMRMWEWYLLSRSATTINDVIKGLDFDTLYPEIGT